MALEPGEISHRARENLIGGHGHRYWLTSIAFSCFLVKVVFDIDALQRQGMVIASAAKFGRRQVDSYF